MQRFHTNQWDYNADAIASILELSDTLETACPGASATDMLEAFVNGGGKAFGLKVCELIAGQDARIRVPLWKYIDPIEISHVVRRSRPPPIDPIATERIVLRSSERAEDWRDGSAGGRKSKEASPDEIPAYLADVWQDCEPVVMQEHVSGIGIVVDIGYSILLGRVVIRMATGRDWYKGAQRRFSSGTNDKEGLHDLFEQDGSPVVPTHHGVLFSDLVYQIPRREIAEVLLQSVTNLGITFGIQLELIVHPDQPNVWHLVQIRPSPEQVRPTFSGFHATGRILATTPVVNKSFRCAGEIVPIKDQSELFGIDPGMRIPQNIVAQYSGRIVLWEEAPQEDFGVFAMQTLSRSGVSGQISRGVIRVNTTHATVREGNQGHEDAWKHVNASQAILGINDDAFEVLRDFAHHTKTCIEIVSDGLVGQILSKT